MLIQYNSKRKFWSAALYCSLTYFISFFRIHLIMLSSTSCAKVSDSEEQTHLVDEAFVFIAPFPPVMISKGKMCKLQQWQMTETLAKLRFITQGEFIAFKILALPASNQVTWPLRVQKQVTGNPASTMAFIAFVKQTLTTFYQQYNLP